MRLWLALAGAALLGIGAACSQSSSSAPATPVDAGAVDDASVDADEPVDAGAQEAACGPPPWVTVGLIVTSAADQDGGFVNGATLTSTACPGVARTSGADGTIVGAVSKGMPFIPRFEQPSYMSTLVGEMRFDADRAGLHVPLLPLLFKALIPGGWSAEKTALVVGLKAEGSGACAAVDGVAISIPGHPEATVTYLSADTIPAPTTDTVTTVGGSALVMGLATGLVVQPSATKPGCTVTFAEAPYTGNMPTEAGSVTLVPGFVH